MTLIYNKYYIHTFYTTELSYWLESQKRGDEKRTQFLAITMYIDAHTRHATKQEPWMEVQLLNSEVLALYMSVEFAWNKRTAIEHII